MTIFFVVALQAEASAIVRFFKLKLYKDIPFKIYRNEHIWLIISGVGKVNSAAATSYLYAVSQPMSHQQWWNVGIAGHRTLPLGSAIVAHKIIDRNTQKKWYPPLLIDIDVKTQDVITVDAPETNYPETAVYDMECSAFYQIATKFASSECVHSFKVISDNENENITNITKHKIEHWLKEQMELLNTLCSSIETVISHLPAKYPKEWQVFLNKWSFTSAGKKRLRALLQKWDTLSPCVSLMSIELCDKCRNMKQVLAYVQKKVEELGRVDTP